MLGININYDQRIYGFDLLRAYAIFRVANGHGGHFLNGTIFENFPWFVSPSGVDIFFVLSGFLIGYSFISNINKSKENNTLKLSLNFWKRASFRILPNYYFILIIHYYLTDIGMLNGNLEKNNMWLFATFTQNLVYPFSSFFWESWSIAVQEWFYLLFPVLLLIGTRFLNVKKSILIIILLFIGTSLFYRIYMNNAGEYNRFLWDINFRKVTASRIDSIAFGILAAWIRYYYSEIWGKYALYAFIAGIALFVGVVYMPFNLNTIYANIIILSIPPIAIMLTFPLIDKLKNIKTRIGKIITHFSILSYAIYLTNLLINRLIITNYTDVLSDNGIVNYIAFWLITLASSYLLYMLIEKPIYKYGNKIFHTTKMMRKKKAA